MIASNLFPHIIWSGSSRMPLIYLTFDDGPDPSSTPQLLEILGNERVSATFFLLGSKVARHPEIVKRIVAEGHLVGNHSYSHPQMIFKSRHFLEAEVLRTNHEIMKVTGQTPRFFRPPYGRFGINVLFLCKQLHLRLVLWNLMPHDYKRSVSADLVLKRIDKAIKNGRIIVLHDNGKLISILPEIISRLKKREFYFSTLDAITRRLP